MDSNLDFERNNDSTLNSFEDIDFNLILNFFQRNKKFISSISIIFLFIGGVYSFFPKRTWEGQFQIVLNSEPSNSKLSKLKPFSKSIASLANIGSSNLKTEVGILKSPSVLMPAYEVATGFNNESSNNIYDFSGWKNNNLIIQLERNTSILNISYTDTNKSNILPVLEKMSSTYQEYSGKRKKRIDQNIETYLKEQIQFFKEKSSESVKRAQEFAIEQNLIFFDTNIVNNKKKSSSSRKEYSSFANESAPFPPQNINIENVRVSAANEIRKIDLQLEKIAKLNELEEPQYIGSIIPALIDPSNKDFFRILEEIELDLVELKSKYTEGDISVRRLIEKRNLAAEMLNQRAINSLKAKRLEAEARMEAALRPKGVILKYKELIRNSSRDESTLIELENELRAIEVEKAREAPSWELITKPTLSNYPVDNLKRDICLLSLFFGILVGSLYSFFKEKKSGKIFEYKDLKKLIGLESGQIMKFNCNTQNDQNTFLNEYIKQKYSDGINLIKLGTLEESKIKIIKEYLKTNKIKIDIFDSILDLKNRGNTNINFLILEFGFFTISQVKTLKKYLQLFEKNIEGIIIIEQD